VADVLPEVRLAGSVIADLAQLAQSTVVPAVRRKRKIVNTTVARTWANLRVVLQPLVNRRPRIFAVVFDVVRSRAEARSTSRFGL